MCCTRYDGCCRIVVDLNTNFDINVDRRTDGQTDGRTEKQMHLLQNQKVREMFHARFDGCLVL